MTDPDDHLTSRYLEWDAQLASGARSFDQPFFETYLTGFRAHPAIETVTGWKQRSMLAVESLLLMRAFAMEARGPILEIGAYIGGGTLALADGARSAGGKQLVTIEVGGSHDHPILPSRDIVADWRETLDMHGYAGGSELVVGWANLSETAALAMEKLRGDRIAMVVIDANGMPFDNLHPYRARLADDCLFVFDDYCNLSSPEQNEKFAMTRASVDMGVDAGALVRYGVAEWGTWFGRRGPAFDAFVDEARRDEHRRAGWRK
jgi:hypothetical protein